MLNIGLILTVICLLMTIAVAYLCFITVFIGIRFIKRTALKEPVMWQRLSILLPKQDR